MVIGETLFERKLIRDRVEERLWITDRAEGGNRWDERAGRVAERGDSRRTHLRLKHRRVRCVFGDFVAQIVGALDLIGPRDHDHVCSGETAEWFAQAAVWQQLSTTPRVCRVDSDDVHVTLQSQVLKAIVEHETIGAELSDRFVAGRYAICIA